MTTGPLWSIPILSGGWAFALIVLQSKMPDRTPTPMVRGARANSAASVEDGGVDIRYEVRLSYTPRSPAPINRARAMEVTA